MAPTPVTLPQPVKRSLSGSWSFLKHPTKKDIQGPGGKRRKGLDRPPGEFDYLLVMDFEWTCDNKKAVDPLEIIEFPAVLYRQVPRSPLLQYKAEFQRYCRPTANPRLSAFCTELTGIQQEQVDAADTLAVVMAQFAHWLEEQGLMEEGVRFAVVTWSDADCLSAITRNCQAVGLEIPEYFRRWVNLKVFFKQHFRREPTGGLKNVVEGLGFNFDGRAHCGLDDARNTGKIAQRMVSEGFRFWRYTRINLAAASDVGPASVAQPPMTQKDAGTPGVLTTHVQTAPQSLRPLDAVSCISGKPGFSSIGAIQPLQVWSGPRTAN